ncbi:MAG: phosphoribosylamine--glycine ligase [Clostridia bacterium]
MNKKYNIAVIGSGGREHSICFALRKSKRINNLYALPGNAGIAQIAECVSISTADFDNIRLFCKEYEVDMVFVAPDDPLALGLVDYLQESGIRAFGPNKAAAYIEASKAFSKDFMKRHKIATAQYSTFMDIEQAKEFIRKATYPLVIKADGLALGKGVIICKSLFDAEKALEDIMLLKVFKSAGEKVVIEEYLTGVEMSIFIFTDGTNYKIMPSSQDYKKAYDNDEGLNTGGMGAICPSPLFTERLKIEIEKSVILPTLEGLRSENRTFKGVLYFGVMVKGDDVKVLEYNARFGDPETQVILPLLKSDLVDIMDACIDGNLDKIDIEWEDKACVTVVVTSGGYPGKIVKGYPIEIGKMEDVILFHMGTAIINERLSVNGGRVICVTAIDKDIENARKKIYSQIDKIKFTAMRYRSDIGAIK